MPAGWQGGASPYKGSWSKYSFYENNSSMHYAGENIFREIVDLNEALTAARENKVRNIEVFPVSARIFSRSVTPRDLSIHQKQYLAFRQLKKNIIKDILDTESLKFIFDQAARALSLQDEFIQEYGDLRHGGTNYMGNVAVVEQKNGHIVLGSFKREENDITAIKFGEADKQFYNGMAPYVSKPYTRFMSLEEYREDMSFHLAKRAFENGMKNVKAGLFFLDKGQEALPKQEIESSLSRYREMEKNLYMIGPGL